jgi:Resolvase, N terminal domain
LPFAQQGLDTTTPAGKAMFQMMGVFAEFERAMIRKVGGPQKMDFFTPRPVRNAYLNF